MFMTLQQRLRRTYQCEPIGHLRTTNWEGIRRGQVWAKPALTVQRETKKGLPMKATDCYLDCGSHHGLDARHSQEARSPLFLVLMSPLLWRPFVPVTSSMR